MKNIEKLLQLLNVASVRYVVIGATSFAAHGWVRATVDLDLFVATDEENLKRLRMVLSDFGYDVSDATLEDFRKLKILFRQYDLPVDIHPFVKGISDFESVWKRRKISRLGATRIPFASLDDLIRMKIAAGRPKDREDLRQLRRLKRKK